MPIIVNLTAMLLFGAGLAAAGKSSPAFKKRFVNWVLLLLLGFVAFIITPATTYAFRFYPQWSMMYLFDPHLFPYLDQWINLLSAASAASNFIAATLGYGVARAGLLTKKPFLWSAPFVLGLLTLSGTLFFQFDRIAYVGDYDTYAKGQADLFVQTAPGLVGALTHLGGFLFVLWVHSRFSGRDPDLI